MTNVEKFEFFEEWIKEIDEEIGDRKLSLINSPGNKRLWELEQKWKIYNSNKELRDFFHDKVLEMDVEMEIELGDISCLKNCLDLYILLKYEAEKEMERYK